MSTITKEQIEMYASAAEATQTFEMDKGKLICVEPEHMLELARIALASLEAEPVGEVVLGEYDDCGCHPDARVVCIAADGQADWENFKDGTRLYTAPPAPVAVTDLTALDNLAGEMLNHAMNCERRVAVAYTHCAHRLAEEVRDLRAAMLQGAEPVTTDYKLPANTPCKDAPEHIWLQTAGVWPESGEFSELTWCSDNQHPDDTLYVRADVVAGNSPAIPDGWVMLPAEPTQAMMNAWLSEVANWRGHAAGYRAMIAAAPQQEVK